MNPKILILSISSWNSVVGANTWPSLVKEYDPNLVASISLRDEFPDSNCANSYFVISESRVLKSIFKRKIKTGHIVGKTQSEEEKNSLSSHNAIYKKRGSKLFYRIAREIVWKLGKWKTDELNSFLKEFNPDIILYSMDGYIHFNKICLYVKRYTKAKSIGFFVDDNFTYKQSHNIFHIIFRFFQKKSLKKLVKYTDAFWSITDFTKEEVKRVFDVDSTVVTKPAYKKSVFTQSEYTKPYKIIYAGNLSIGRDKSLKKIIKALNIMNEKEIKYVIDIYTSTNLSTSFVRKHECDFCHFHKAVKQTEILKLYPKYDILLFLESLSLKNKNIARLSFSTKIVDYLTAARCIFAVGSPNTAPIKYLSDNKAALVSSTFKEILLNFKKINDDEKVMDYYAKNASICSNEKHNSSDIFRIVDSSIKNTLNKLEE